MEIVMKNKLLVHLTLLVIVCSMIYIISDFSGKTALDLAKIEPSSNYEQSITRVSLTSIVCFVTGYLGFGVLYLLLSQVVKIQSLKFLFLLFIWLGVWYLGSVILIHRTDIWDVNYSVILLFGGLVSYFGMMLSIDSRYMTVKPE